jgi:hypothetical protein
MSAMKFLELLDRVVRPIAIPNLTQIIIAGQAMLFLASLSDPTMVTRATLVWSQVLQGEVWRLVTFLFIPPTSSPLWLFFALYIFYLFGTSLEQYWGVVRYNGFFWLGLILTVAVAALVPNAAFAGTFLSGTVFLAFATINPNFTLNLFLILPVKVKWLAWFQAAGYGFIFLKGGWVDKLAILASVGNYLIFFAPQVVNWFRHRYRRKQWEARQFKPGSTARHTCAVCGIDSNSHPQMEFRYCSKCGGEKAYCEEHLRNHQHVGELPNISRDRTGDW